MDDFGKLSLTSSSFKELKITGKIKQILFYSTEDILIDFNPNHNEASANSEFLWPKNSPLSLDKDDTDSYEKVYQTKFDRLFFKLNTMSSGYLYYIIRRW